MYTRKLHNLFQSDYSLLLSDIYIMETMNAFTYFSEIYRAYLLATLR